MARLFGTDGVRGLANKDLTAELALSLARAAAQILATPSGDGSAPTDQRPRAVVGRDPRASGEMLEQAVCAGLTAAGVDAVRVGVLPTPAVAYLTAQLDASFGVMISASHNPMPDNGIKFFDGNGGKLADAVEDRIEAAMAAPAPGPTGAGIGRVTDVTDALDRYIDHVVSTVSHDLSALTVVVDCAQGAAWAAAPSAYQKAGATVIAINADPTGLDINDGCGSTHLEQLQQAVIEHRADLGLAHDGDADRCLAVDANGQVIDGDMIMAVLAVAMHERGELVDSTLVATVMSNLGLHIGMRTAGITVRTTAVGDRYVLEDLRAGGYSLGGEQSGHVVIPRAATTGDGILTGLSLLDRMAATQSTIAALASVMTVLPQVLINVPVADKSTVAQSISVKQAVADAENSLGDQGRVLLRPSGTEQLVRVMVEAPTQDGAASIAKSIAAVVESAQ